MKFAVIGGAGAMGGLFGGTLARAGAEVALLDVSETAVERIRREGLRIDGKDGSSETIRIRAETDPRAVGEVDVALVFVKRYHTEAAIREAAPHLSENATFLTLQNGWGNASLIASLVGEGRVVAGVTYHSATVLEPGRIHHAGIGKTRLGELAGGVSERVRRIADAFNAAGLETEASDQVVTEIWSKLALNLCTLPTSALLRFTAGQLIEHEETLALMRSLLEEGVAVANAQGIPLDAEERWDAIVGLLRRAGSAKASMLQDVENLRRTEIDAINGAVVEAGARVGVPTPCNETMVRLIRALEQTYLGGSPSL